MKTGVQTPVFAVKTDKSKEAVGSHSCEIKTGHLLKQIPCFWSERRDSNRDRAALRAAADGLFDGIEEAVGSYSAKQKRGICQSRYLVYGPSDGIRTHGLLVPNQARYQLRYARMYLVIIPTVAGFVKNGGTKVVDKIHAQGYNEPKWR